MVSCDSQEGDSCPPGAPRGEEAKEEPAAPEQEDRSSSELKLPTRALGKQLLRSKRLVKFATVVSRGPDDAQAL